MKNKNIQSLVLSFVVVAIFLLSWEFAIRAGLVKAFFVGQPSKIFKDFWDIVSTGLIFPHIGITLEETMLGLVVGTVAGVIVAFILDRFELVDKTFSPIFTALNGLPKMALAPLFILMFGLGMKSKVFLAGLMVFFLILFNVYAGLKSIDPVLVETIKLMKGNSLQIVRKISLPSILPWLFAGLQAGIGMALGGAVIGEYMGASGGLGWMIFTAGSMFNMNRLMSCLLVLTIILVLLYAAVNLLKNQLLKWRPPVARRVQ